MNNGDWQWKLLRVVRTLECRYSTAFRTCNCQTVVWPATIALVRFWQGRGFHWRYECSTKGSNVSWTIDLDRAADGNSTDAVRAQPQQVADALSLSFAAGYRHEHGRQPVHGTPFQDGVGAHYNHSRGRAPPAVPTSGSLSAKAVPMVSVGIPANANVTIGACPRQATAYLGNCLHHWLLWQDRELVMARHCLCRALEVDQSCCNPNKAMLTAPRRMLTWVSRGTRECRQSPGGLFWNGPDAVAWLWLCFLPRIWLDRVNRRQSRH